MKLVSLISALFAVGSAQFRQRLDPHNNTLACACILRDIVRPMDPGTTVGTTSTTTTTESPTISTSSEESIKRFIPYNYWQIYKKNIQNAKVNPESYMDRFLSLFREEPTTTTTQSTTQEFLVQEDSPITDLGKQLFYKYVEKLRAQFGFLDRFICSCEGDLAAVLNSKTFISMSLIHD
ncbi:unnamed protein product [Cylicocyclus nassatus]|uniref:Uncharacterized protein n=1 Tax=Cylicocyclus nassatus TaxID=53992 RepID=A0AA36H602_CYLNA|nr:unnamed protein product [Cylicocyclus nassatus]